MRRVDVEEQLGRIPTPDVETGMHLVEILFQIGPIRGELPLCEFDLESWERRRGIELSPWQAELIVELSKAYLTEMHAARSWSALCPWPKGRNMWKLVQDRKHAKKAQEEAAKPQTKEPHGSRQRYRNPPPG